MNLIKSLMGRRQFLIAAGVTSTSALALNKFAGTIDPGFQTGYAMAADRAGTAEMKGNFSNRYSNLLSPLKIGNVILKNRMIHSRSFPHFLQGPETFPSEASISHYAGVARNGAAIVTVKCGVALKDRKALQGDSAHMTMWEISDPAVQNYYAQIADAVHFYDSKASIGLNIMMPAGYSISESSGGTGGGPGGMAGTGMPAEGAGRSGEAPGGAMPGGMGGAPGGAPGGGAGVTAAAPSNMTMGNMPAGKEIPVNLIQEMIDATATQAKFYQALGYDGVNIYMSYRSHMLAHALSPALNKRTDKYGGSLENRARFPLEVFRAIKKACGQDFLIEAQISGEEVAGGYTIEDVVQYAKIWEGAVDIIQLRATDATPAHPMGWNSEKGKPLTLKYGEALKKSGAKVVTAVIGGYQDPDLNEEFIASGKTDMIAMARTFIADSEYGKKAYEGRGEDVIPCIRCNKCHGDTTWLSFCSVNPKLGQAHRLNRMIEAPALPKKVAVIGGGPAGMKAAITAAERGHKVTIYEKNGYLGGMLRHTDFASFQWPLRDFKDYLIRQVNKAGVQVHLNTEATPDMIRKKGYDAVVVAAGTEPIVSKIPGADGSNVWNVINVYGNEKALGKNVVVIGGGRGAEIGLHLSLCGHKVTVLASGKQLVQQEGPHQGIHFGITDTFNYIVEATTRGISDGKVTYLDAKGQEKTIQADSVVIFAGLKPKQDEAMKFYGSANGFFIVGDCTGNGGDVRKVNRIAYAAASRI
jgi:2,4-dienoyl-CoA reductase-like NADH-dependent reductase (Old Yellow Enzyme family)/thioredoxin reductase